MTNFCGNCGQKVDAKTGLCSQCNQAILMKRKKRNKLVRIVVAVLCCISIIAVGIFGALKFFEKDVVSYTYGEYHSFMEGFTDVLVTDEKSAIEAVGSVSDALGIKDAEKELKVISVNNVDGDSYYRMQQYYKDIPVYGKNIVVSADKNGKATALTSNFNKIDSEFVITPSITQNQIEQSIQTYFQIPNIEISCITENQLVIYIEGDDVKLTYEISLTINNMISIIFVDAQNADVIAVLPLLQAQSSMVVSSDDPTSAIGWKNDDGSHHLYNDEFKISIFDLKDVDTTVKIDGIDFRQWGVDTVYSNTNFFDSGEVILLNNAIKTSEFFREIGDKGFDEFSIGFNEQYISKGHGAVGGSSTSLNKREGLIIIEKADGNELRSIDLLAHEYTHAISGSIIGWGGSKSEETGAINEGYSDVFGELVEAYVKKETPDWIHGQRNLVNPHETENKKYPYPASVNEVKDAKTGKDKNGDLRYLTDDNKGEDYAHFASTIISHSAYLMWNGINGEETMKIDSETLAKLWYRAMLLFHSNVNFGECANSLMLSATHMVRLGQLSQTQLQCVAKALDRVDILEADNYPSVISGGKIIVKDIDLNSYGNYHISIKEIPKLKDYLQNNTVGKTVAETDVASSDGYTIDLKDGLYSVCVSDNQENGSAQEFKTVVHVVEENILNKYYLPSKSITIYTDFGELTPEMVEYLNWSFGDLKAQFGENYTIYEMSGWIPDSEGSDRVIRYNDNSTPLEFQITYSYGTTPSTINDNTFFNEIRFANIVTEEVITIFDNVKTNTTYGELKNEIDGILCKGGIDNEFLYVYKVDDKRYVVFDYFEYPTDATIADYVYVTTSPSYWEMSLSLYPDDIITLTGTLEKEKYYVNAAGGSEREAIILKLEQPITKKLVDYTLGYYGEEKTMDSVQLQLSNEEFELYKNKIVSITGNVYFANTVHDIKDVVLYDCTIK